MEKITALSKGFFDRARNGESPWPARTFLCLAVLMAYSSVWPSTFVLDDKPVVEWNIFLQSWSGLPKLFTTLANAKFGLPGGFYRPLPLLVYFLIYRAIGPAAIAFHALNIFLQAVNACLLHHFGLRAGFRKGAAFAAALLWALHPLHTSNVAYIASVAEILSGSFCLLGLITLLPDFTSRKIWVAMIFFVLALLSKECAVVFPALAAATFFFTSEDRTRIPAYVRMWPLWLLSACYISAWMLYMHVFNYTIYTGESASRVQDYTLNFTHRVLTSLATLPVYARLIVWPAELHIERVFPVFSTLLAWQPLTGLLMALLGLVQIVRGIRGQKGVALSFGLLWFAVALSPYTGIVMPIDAIISEGWMYTPTMGLFLGIAQTAAGVFEKRQNAAAILVAVLAISLGAATFFQSEVWRNPETLYQNISQNGGRTDHLSYNLGLFYLEQGEFDKAIGQFQSELDRLGNPRWGDIHLRLAMAWLQVRLDNNDSATLDDVVRAIPSSPNLDEALTELGETLRDDPRIYQAHLYLAAIYRYQGNKQMADFHWKQAQAALQKRNRH